MRDTSVTASLIRPTGGFPRRAIRSRGDDKPLYSTPCQDDLYRKAVVDRQREQQEADNMRRRATVHAQRLQ